MMKALWLMLGCAMLTLGVIGALLPLMPTTIFLILALACFSRSSPRLARYLLDNPAYGPALRAWREQGEISRQGKRYALLGMAVGYGLFWWRVRPSLWLALGAGVLLLASAAYVLTRPGVKTRRHGRQAWLGMDKPDATHSKT